MFVTKRESSHCLSSQSNPGTNLPRGQKVQVCSPIPTPVTVHPLQSKSFRWRSNLLVRIVRFTLVLGTDEVDDLVVEVDREQTVIP